jgi:hypothetical protein
MLLVNLLNKDRPCREDNDDIANLPWLTDTDLVQIQQELPFLRQQRADGAKPVWFKTYVPDDTKINVL